MTDRPIVKFCGFRDIGSIKELGELGVDMVGFILAPSKRRVSIETLSMITKAVPNGIDKVGVFVNPSLDEIQAVMDQALLTAIQLHGEESPEFCAEVKGLYGVKLIKAVHVGGNKVEDIHASLDPYKGIIDYLLLDTYDPKEAGGTGKTFRWDILPTYYQWCNQCNIKLIVAGGIQKENVLNLLENWPLHGIDVSSGIETEGVKDRKKMKELMERVRENVRST